MTKQIKATKTFIIRHKETKEIWSASSGKTSWKATNHAASAWANSDHKHTKDITTTWCSNKYSYWEESPKFREQDVYEIVEVKPESEDKLQEAYELLKICAHELDNCNEELSEDVWDWLEENKIDQD